MKTALRPSPWMAGIDVGRSKVAVVIGRVRHDQLEIIGHSTHRFRLTDRAHRVNVDIDENGRAMSAALIEAARMGGVPVPRRGFVATCAAGPRSIPQVGRAIVRGEVVETADVMRALEDAQAADDGVATAHVMPTAYVLDGERRVADPLGCPAHRLEAHVQRLAVSKARLRALEQVAKQCDLRVDGVGVDVLAASEATLLPSEREEGVVLIDVGHASTDIAVWLRGRLVHTAHLATAGSEVSRDIRQALGVKHAMAERLAREFGVALTDVVDAWETIPLPQRSGEPYKRRVLGTICEPRIREILKSVRDELVRAGYGDMVRGAVLTGGTSMLAGTLDLAEGMLGVQARYGKPRRVTGLIDSVCHPKYATAVGALGLGVGRGRRGASTSGMYPVVRMTRWQMMSRQLTEVVNRLF